MTSLTGVLLLFPASSKLNLLKVNQNSLQSHKPDPNYAQVLGCYKFSIISRLNLHKCSLLIIRFDTSHVVRSEEHTSELQSRETNSYAVFCLKKKKKDKMN